MYRTRLAKASRVGAELVVLVAVLVVVLVRASSVM